MTQSSHRETIIVTLLNALEEERYVRGPLLATAIDELSTCSHLVLAADAARSLLASLEAGTLGEPEFARRVAELRNFVQALSRSKGLRESAEDVTRTLESYTAARVDAA